MTLRHLFHTLATTAAAAALALVGTAAPAHAADDIGTTPGTYTRYSFAGEPKLTEVTWSTTVLHDPGYRANVFWSHQFGFDKGNGAYVGMQSNGGSKRTLLFSVWDVSEAKPGSAGSWCQGFGGEGEGMSCRLHLDWTAGHRYTFRIAAEGDGWFGATVTDTATSTAYRLGSIKTPATVISPTGMVDWTEYFEWNDSRATCYDQPFSDARFGVPTGNGGKVTGAVASTTNNGNACAPMTRTDTAKRATVQNLGVGNSVRGAVEGPGGRCLTSEDGVKDGAVAGLRACKNAKNQSWVRAADGSLRLPSDYCLSTEGALVGVKDCAGTGAGGAVTDAARQWTYDDSAYTLVNKASGQCLSAYGKGKELRLQDCEAGSADQRWSVPATS
ncbi:ricin-type beta-trefoil lectin domain protein [Streptomyces sp. NBC_00209]|uniref:RICIN domain-containing protein n=1 Tax=Streptomyces sp. NBC_00209 TaxID=2975682 RepID=UPI00324D33B8